MDDIVIRTTEIHALQQSSVDWLGAVKALSVIDKESHGACLGFIVMTKGAEKTVRGKLDPIIDQANRAHKSLTALRADMLAPNLIARGIAVGKANEYVRIENEKAAAESRRLELEAKRAEDERQLEDALLAESLGQQEEAEQILDAPSAPARIIHVEPNVAKIEGVSTRTVYKGQVVDLFSLVQFVAANPTWVHLLQPNTTAINAVVRAQGAACSIPGIKVVSDTSIAVRGVKSDASGPTL